MKPRISTCYFSFPKGLVTPNRVNNIVWNSGGVRSKKNKIKKNNIKILPPKYKYFLKELHLQDIFHPLCSKEVQ